MNKLRVYYDREGNTLSVWFDDPKKEYVCEEADDDLILVKDRRGPSHRLRATQLPHGQAAGRGRGRSRGSSAGVRAESAADSPHFADAITSSCTRLRVCSFSKYSRPFLTLTWSHGSTSSSGRLRCEYHA